LVKGFSDSDAEIRFFHLINIMNKSNAYVPDG
jgi:hypothetical protein